MVKQGDSLAQPTLKRQTSSLRHRTYLYGTGILTGFPSTYPVKVSLRTDLPPADEHCRGTRAHSAVRILT